jgi:D-alanyl-D-alanine carboxypeptidase
MLAAWFCLVGAVQQPAAGTEQVCPGQIVPLALDGRLLGHIPYDEVPASELVPAPPGFAIGQPCFVNRAMLPDLTRLIDAARAAPGVGNSLRGVSCFRSIARQRAIFCGGIGPRRASHDPAERARTSAPPGHSEHGTGYALDFGVVPSPHCPEVSDCIAGTPGGQWLLDHASEYGFELSFPPGNAQGVTWEPWHWRWVGTSMLETGALRARLLFARARNDFPASPAVPDARPNWLTIVRDPPPALTPTITLPPLQVPFKR